MKNLLPHFIQEQYQQGKTRGQLQAFAMFIDLSGFTPLTEVLMGKGNRGAEELSIILNDIFTPLVNLVYARGGFIPYFAGDAFTAIFPARQTSLTPIEFVQTALQVRGYFKSREFQFSDFIIGLKIGLSWGRVEWGIVGQQYKSFYFRGSPIDNSAQCQTRAKNQDIILDDSMRLVLNHSPFELEQLEPHFFRLLNNNASVDGWKVMPIELPEIDIDFAKQFLPESVIHLTGDGEFRSVIAVFISFSGVESHDLLDQFANIVLENINNFSGYFKEIDFGDKGGVMTCFFGAPVSFENSIDRALEFIFSVKEDSWHLQEESGLRVRAGMTIGTAYTGFVGGQERCQYAAVGNRVNLAARLMTFADWGEVLVDAEIRKTRHFTFDHKGDIKYKGIRGNVPTFKLEGRNADARLAFLGQMVGRELELQKLLDFSAPLFDKKPAGIAYIFGEAGIGKSRLTHELKQILTQEGKIDWMICQSDQILRKPFNPFIYFLRNYFEQSLDGISVNSREKFEHWFQRLQGNLKQIEGYPEIEFIDRELIRTQPVLAALIGIPYENSIWDHLDAKGRYQNTIQAILTLMIAESLVQPIVVQLEDAHWIDENSRELLQELVKYLGRYPILLLVTSRLRDDGTQPLILEQEALEANPTSVLEINLNILEPASVRHFTELYLRGPITDEFFELLLRATNSNPFYLEQVLEYFSESNLLEFDDAWTIKDKNIPLSGSINAILTARIDRLSNLVKETVKAAAVIGREFELPVLNEVMKGQEEFVRHNGNASTLLREQIQVAERGQIWDAMNELRYIFRHSLLREAAYGMQLRTRLQQLHQLIAEAIERLYADRLEERYFDLAFHYEQADVFDKTVEYLRKAADYARRNYQNQLALDYYEKLLKKLANQNDAEKQIRTYLQKGKVLELIGKWEECEKTYTKALKLAKRTRDVLLLGQCNNSLGRLLVLKGDYINAAKYLQTAVQLFEMMEEKSGIAKVYGNLGNLHMRQGKYEEAKFNFTQSIELSRSVNEIPNAQIVANLGITYMNQGKYEEAIRCQQEQLVLSQRSSDKQGMADLYTKIGIVYFDQGNYDEALENYKKGLELSEELGNKQLTAIAIGCIGTVYERKGDYDKAMAHFERDLQLCEELGDKQGIAITLGLIGELMSYKGEFYKAIDYLQKDLMICEQLGYQKGMAKAVNTLADIFFYLKEYPRAIQHYNRAIDITKKIGNKLVLGFSLTEKGAVLIETGALEELNAVVQEALSVALELGNPELWFEAQILSAKSFRLYGNKAQAQIALKGLLSKPLQKSKQAAVYAELYKVLPHEKSYRENALVLYRELYAATPKYTFKKQIEMLENETKGL